MRLLALLVVLASAPLAAAQGEPARETLSSLEAPHEGTDKVWEVTVLPEEAGKPRALIMRNPIGSRFDVEVMNAQGERVYNLTASRAVHTLPALDAGNYSFFVRRTGSFQVTEKAFERDGLMGFDGKLAGPADAYVLAPTNTSYNVSITGDVAVDWWDLTAAPEELRAPVERAAKARGAYVITITGAEGAPYAIALEATSVLPPTPSPTPAPGATLFLAVLGIAALMMRRRT